MGDPPGELDWMRMAQESSRWDRRAVWGLLALVFIIALLPRLISNDHALSSDEPYILNWTNQFYTAVMHGDLRGKLIGRFNSPSGHDTLTVALPSRFRRSHLDDSPLELLRPSWS